MRRRARKALCEAGQTVQREACEEGAAPLYLLLAWGLWRQSRTVAWLQFFTALVGAVLAYLFKPLFALPEVWAWALVVIDVDVAVLMLLILWPSRQRASAGA